MLDNDRRFIILTATKTLIFNLLKKMAFLLLISCAIIGCGREKPTSKPDEAVHTEPTSSEAFEPASSEEDEQALESEEEEQALKMSDSKPSSISIAYSHTIRFPPTSELVLGFPTEVKKDAQGNILWGALNAPIYIFSPEGTLVSTLGAMGQGPGEYTDVTQIAMDKSGNLYVFDMQQRRVSIFDKNYTFLRVASLVLDYSVRMAIDREGKFYFLRDKFYSGSTPAIQQYLTDGTKAKGWGELPYGAHVSKGMGGGGVVIDRQGNIYYGYMGEHKIYKISGSQTTTFDQKPSYFISAEKEGIDKALKEIERVKIVHPMIQYAGSISRVHHLFYAEPGLIFQEVHTKVPFIMTLEVWTTSGKKIGSNIEIPGFMMYADEDHLYFLNDDETEEENRSILVYTYTVK